MLNVQVCSSNVLVLEGRGIGKGRGKREIESEAFAEMEKKNRQSPQPGIELPRQTWLMLGSGGHQPHFPAGAFGDYFFYFCQSLTSHLPFTFPSSTFHLLKVAQT